MVHETRAARGKEIHDTKTIEKIGFLLVGEDARHGCLGIACFKNDFVELSPNKSEDRICFAYYNAVTWILNLFA